MGNFSTFCREEKKLTASEIGEVIVIHFLLVVCDFCNASYISIVNFCGKKINVCEVSFLLGGSF